jgi:nucleoside-diphosphate-sugar epimerase
MDSALNGQVVLVTGATGFIGTHLVRRLAAGGAVVHAYARRRIEPADADHPAVTSWVGDIRDAASLTRMIDDIRPDVVFHLAATTAVRSARGGSAFADAYDVNVRGTLNLLIALDAGPVKPRAVIRLGGLEEYGRGPVPFDEDQRERPVSAYSASQVTVTHLCQSFWLQTGLSIVSLRPALTYGPGQSPTFFIPGLIEHAIPGRDFDMTGGEQTRDFIFVADLIDACVQAAASSALEGTVINIGSGREYRIRDVAEMIVRLVGRRIDLRSGSQPERKIDLARLVCRTDLAERALGWRATTSLEDGLALTIAHERDRQSRIEETHGR